MDEIGTLPIDHTICLFAAVLNNLESGLTWKAQARMEDDLDIGVVESWTNLQCSMGERLQRDLDAGYINESQLDFALEWLSTLDQLTHDEAIAHFMAWVSLVRG